MSLGFLTESALVPSKAKAIKVDAKSLVDLKAVVFQKEQERKRRLHEAATAAATTTDNDSRDGRNNETGYAALRRGKYSHLRGNNKRWKPCKEDQVGRKSQNAGVEARSRRDEEVRARDATPDEDDDAAWCKLSAERLREKAKLYEEMMRGGRREDERTAECLVDFEAKQAMAAMTRTTEATTGVVEITDAFGRTRSVALDSDEYAAFQETQQQQQQQEDEREGRGESELVKGKRCDDGEGRSEDGSRVDGGSFVVSQWEKRLNRSEKDHLMEVHERATSARLLARTALSGSARQDRKTRKQLRLERLRKQRVEAATSGEKGTAELNDEVDRAASERASDFLNQLSSFM
ncbi:unnamed protein product [Hyaloperonospora brassicae]|uniref:Uncharacterized protein n=1 Tax=Hyaloperonospora brassicae TaxID=162125 RepID=A0AAV0V4G2_HYABA|nr:unnamed protein product [Hyaloperonospora brassicae]